MAKAKYYFNTTTLKYEKYRPSITRILLYVIGFLSFTTMISLGMIVTVFQVIDTPQERVLKNEVNHYQSQFKLLNARVERMREVVEEIEYKDDNIYRVLLEADPIDKSVRKGGFGGIDRYSHLKEYSGSELVVQTTKYVDQLENQLKVLNSSFEEIKQLAYDKDEMFAAVPAIQPVANTDLKHIASGFGPRRHPVYRTVRHHDGVDFSAPTGTEVYATGDGRIKRISRSRRGYGNHVVIDHGFEYETLYAHLDDINVSHGQKVTRGEVLGTVGNTGMSVAPHLHYEVIKNGKNVDPINYFHNDLSPEEYEKVLEISSMAHQSLD